MTADVFGSLGWRYVRTAPSGRDGGRDFELPCPLFGDDPPYAYVEVEFRRSPVSTRNARKLVNLMCRNRVPRGLFVSWTGPSHAARRAVKDSGALVRWWDADDLLQRALRFDLGDRVRGLVRKYR